MIRALAIVSVLAACGPRVDPKGPGALPEVTEGPAPETTRLPPRPAPAPVRPMPVDDPDPVPKPTDAPPPHGMVKLASAKGSKVSGELSLIQGEDGTTLTGTVTGLAKKATYALMKRDHCVAFKADDDSKRSNDITYGIAITSDATGRATLSDTATVVHLDGPMSLIGAIFVISKSPTSAELACGRVVSAP